MSINSIGWRTYVYFSVFNLFFLPVIYFGFPETRFLSLEQIDRLFTGDKIMLHWDAGMGVPGGVEGKEEDLEVVEHEGKGEL